MRGGQPEAPIRKAAPASVPLARFLLFYTVLCTAIYALVPYKTPWCLMTFLHGMILLAGIGASFLIRALPGLPLRVVVALAMVAPMVHLGVQAYRSNFKAPYYNDERRNPWMYAHSHIDMRRLIARLEKLAAVHPWARRMPVAFFTQDVWPMPYYLRRYVNVGVWPGIPADPHAPFRSVELPYAPVWIVPAQHAGDLVARLYPTLDPQERERQLDRDYAIETFSLRHQVFLTVYIDRRLWDISIRR